MLIILRRAVDKGTRGLFDILMKNIQSLFQILQRLKEILWDTPLFLKPCRVRVRTERKRRR